MKKIGLLTEFTWEVPKCIGFSSKKNLYHLNGHEIFVVPNAGMGPKKAERATNYLLANFSPDRVLFLGICGGAKPHLQTGDLILANAASYYDERISLDSKELREAKEFLLLTGQRFHVGEIQTFPHIKLSVANMNESALAGEMETFFSGQILTSKGIPIVTAKAVSDALQDVNPFTHPGLNTIKYVLGSYEMYYKGIKKAVSSIDRFFVDYLNHS